MNVNKFTTDLREIVRFAEDRLTGENSVEKNNIKNLSQSDRKLLALSCDAFKYMQETSVIEPKNQKKIIELEQHQDELDGLKSKLKGLPAKSRSSVLVEMKHSNFFVRFFKFLGNKLGLRISSDDLRDKIAAAYSIMERKRNIELDALISNLYSMRTAMTNNRPNFSDDQADHIWQTVSNYIQLVKNRDYLKEEFLKDPQHAKDKMKELTNFTIENGSVEDLLVMLDENPELLWSQFQNAQKVGAKVVIISFFNKAFSAEDSSSFEKCSSRIADYIADFIF